MKYIPTLFLYITLGLLSMSIQAGNYFPQNYKEFPYIEGDLLISKRDDGKFAVNKILRIDTVHLKEGESINIQGQIFTAPENDYLLIISTSYGESEFSTYEEAKQAATLGKWNVKIQHAPNRAPGAAEGQTHVGNTAVTEEELVGYNQWKTAFQKGEAGVF